MDLRFASVADLPQLKEMYTKIAKNMAQNNIFIWSETYPYHFFADDIEQNRLYVLIDNHEIAAAFALCDSNGGETYVQWDSEHEKTLYLSRLGVNVNYLKRGLGRKMLALASSLAKEKNATHLRLFVAEVNKPAMRLYTQNHFQKVEGYYDELMDDGSIVREFGFERELSDFEKMYRSQQTASEFSL